MQNNEIVNCELSLSCICQFISQSHSHFVIFPRSKYGLKITYKVLHCAISFCKETNEQNENIFI